MLSRMNRRNSVFHFFFPIVSTKGPLKFSKSDWNSLMAFVPLWWPRAPGKRKAKWCVKHSSLPAQCWLNTQDKAMACAGGCILYLHPVLNSFLQVSFSVPLLWWEGDRLSPGSRDGWVKGVLIFGFSFYYPTLIHLVIS